MYRNYEMYCSRYERTSLTKKAFFAEMEAKGFSIKKLIAKASYIKIMFSQVGKKKLKI